MPGKPNSWDAAADRALLLGILKTHNVTVDNDAMAKYMSKDGYQFTASAIANRMTRLKKMLKITEIDAEDVPATPKPGRKRRASASVDGEPATSKRKISKKSVIFATGHANSDGAAVEGVVKDEAVSGDELS